MRAIKITLVMLLFCQAVLAQKFSVEEIAERKVMKLDEKVTLTETQKVEINTILLESTSQIKELRKAETVNQEAVKQLKMEEKAKIKEILTEEQQTLLKDAKKADRVKNKTQRENIKAYNKEHVKPLVSEKRKAFELLLNQEEKDNIISARNIKAAHKKQDRKSLTEEEKAAIKANREEIAKLLDPIIETHKQQLEVIKTELAPVHEAAKENAGSHEPGGKKKHPKKENKRFEYRFLLSE